MRLIRVGAAVLNQTPLDWDNNRRHILDAIKQAREQSVTILCLPELAITGYGCEDAFHAPATWQTAWQELKLIAAQTEDIIVSVGVPLFHRGGLYNAAALLANGRIVGLAAKRFLAGDGLHYESRWFDPWPAGVVETVEVDGQRVLAGDLLFDCGGIRIGFEICEDAWVAERPGAQLALRGADIILNPSASHFAFGKSEVRERFVREGARAFGVTYVYSNLLGNESGRAIYDGGAIIATPTDLVGTGPRFLFGDVHVTTATVDVDETRMTRVRTASFRPQPTGDEAAAAVDFTFPPVEHAAPSCLGEATDAARRDSALEEFTRAVSLALFDYLRKSGHHGFVVSLSGGADSAAVALLVRTMVDLATQQLGTHGFADRIGRPELADLAAASVVEQLLTCVYQATANSSPQTRYAARTLAEAIGSRYVEFDVEPIVGSYVHLAEQAVGRSLNWERDDIALQNVQSRVRAPGVWLLANLSRSLLLTTGNRSEAAVGYATMDGDTCGGLAPIAGIDKAFLLRWLRWMEHTGPHELPACPALYHVNQLQPTAELRPPELEQTDEGDLMPYPVLDAVERAAIRDKQYPSEVVRSMTAAFPDVAPSQIVEWTRRFFRMWSRNQWKRERYAPSFHVDDANLDPKTWCRFPILSGGFARELSLLDSYAGQDADVAPEHTD